MSLVESHVARWSGPDACRIIHENRFATWSRRMWYQGEDAAHPDDVPRRMREDIFVPGFTSKFKLDRADGVFAMGSCFARVVEDAFLTQGAPVLSRPIDLAADPRFATTNPHVRPIELVNRYNLGSMYAELRQLLDPAAALDDRALVHALEDGAHHDLHYYDHWIASPDRDSLLGRRRLIRETFSTVAHARVIVLTLGLIEAWYDTEHDLYLNVTPRQAIVQAHPRQYEFRLLDYEENLAYLLRIYDLLRRFGREDFRLVVTVSPVPLAGTFTAEDVFVANMRSKCTLRTVAEAFARRFANVDYFPSFEIAQGTRIEHACLADGRHPTAALGQRIVELFQQAYYA
jgi:GSCFA family